MCYGWRLLVLTTLIFPFGCTHTPRDVNPMSAFEVARDTSIAKAEDGTRLVLGPAYRENHRLGGRVYSTTARLVAFQRSPDSQHFEFRMECLVHGLSAYSPTAAFDSSDTPLSLGSKHSREWPFLSVPTHDTRVTIVLLSDYLAARVDRGLALRIQGRQGEVRLTFPGYYILSFLDQVDTGS